MLSLLIILLTASAMAMALPRSRGRLPILMYHKVRPAPADDLTVPLDVFNSQMAVLADRYRLFQR